ncbi:hypothetical protein LY474_04445 [Myxococcus stipitatus]|uniref:hypothetical protein n=1 Tax=Myxococcus stipitatus TaxID=83455 RepID=UPI001F166C35|nr:hypothetical protein [Myxococcus stipitatus]MCE9667057.1 hypothetical protein [Myxococcus stipitatus]
MRSVCTRLVCLAILAMGGAAWAFEPSAPTAEAPRAREAFFVPELVLPSGQAPLEVALPKLGADVEKAWEDFFMRNGKDFTVFIDAQTGTAANIVGAVPLIPGRGIGNAVTLAGLSDRLGREVTTVDEAVVADLVFQFIESNRAAIGVDTRQLGAPRVHPISDDLWQLSFPQVHLGIPVRHGRLAATVSHGNLVLLGTESWSNVDVSPVPLVDAERAMEAGNERFGLTVSPSRLWLEPTLELAPVAAKDASFGKGQKHRLVWTYGLTLPGEHARWKVTVDAISAAVLAIEDDNHYADQSVTGGVYPVTSSGLCEDITTCGTMQPDTPMPWADVGGGIYADSAGMFPWDSGPTVTTLSGRYVRIQSSCGAIRGSGTGNIALGGTNNHHDCIVPPGTSAGNTAAARTAFYQLNRIAQVGRGWLPNNAWLNQTLTANVDIVSTCNAFWNGTTVNFYRSGGGCRNTGEAADVLDHEWGHGLDDNDTAGTLSNSAETYGDIAAAFRLSISCIGMGVGPNPITTCNDANYTARQLDYTREPLVIPSTPQRVCTTCLAGTGPCARNARCASLPMGQAAYDLAFRDLLSYPFNYDVITSLLIGNKLFYQGSGNVGAWHACSCSAGTSGGCGATNGYMQWLAADDDNGNLNDGTPHMTALFNAFNRHNIACPSPPLGNSGCATGPTVRPNVTASPSSDTITLSWAPVPGATEYWVMKSDGVNACRLGMARVATVTAPGFVDTEVLNGRNTCYAVVAASSGTCFTPASLCTCATASW